MDGFTMLKVVYTPTGRTKKPEVKIIWFGFGVSERGFKLKTTLHGAYLMVDNSIVQDLDVILGVVSVDLLNSFLL